jgi:hypothetical protein
MYDSYSQPGFCLGKQQFSLQVIFRTIILAWSLCAFLLPKASAQSEGTIVGVVTDSSGARIAGVTVEVTSPAMIEGARRVTTDGNGQYRVVDLRPGPYTVTFINPGFTSLKHEGITLTASFTATIDATLQVGQTQQQVTVDTAPPLVDVQDSQTDQVMDRQRLDTLPTGRDPFAVGQLIAGVTTSVPDVGGATGMQQPTLQVHGSSGNDNVFMVDGIWIQHVAFSGNQTGFYFNDALFQELVYTTSNLPAEAPIGGIQINMIPREGGNQFHGSIFGTGATQSLESDNLTAQLMKAGLKAQNKIDNLYDINAGLGGPIIKDKLWFYSSFRRWGANNYLANTFTPEGNQALDDNRLTDITLRLTYQINQKNKITVAYDRSFKWRGHRPNNLISASFSDPIADVVQHSWMNYMGQAKWTSTPTSKLVIQAGYTMMPVNYNLLFEPGVAAGTIAAYDITTSTITRASPREDFDRGFMQTEMGSVSYVSGSHDLKTGVESRSGFFQESFVMDGNMLQILSNGVPTAIRLYNTPLTHRENVNPDLGWYLQDTWKLTRRLTLNPGIRFEHMVMSLPAENEPGGTWVPAASYPARNGLVDWNTWSPRFGFAWDVFGDSKTAVRGGVSKYDRLEGSTLIQNVNPAFITYSQCPWTSNVLPTSPAQVAGLACTGFSGNNYHIDPNIKRPYQMEYDVMVQRQLGAHTSASVGYYHRNFYNLYGIVNTDVPSSDYTAVTVTNPLTGQPLTVYNQAASTRGQINYLEKTLPQLYQRYNGVEFQVNTQIAKATVFGGFTIGKDYGTPDGSTTTMDFNNPNNTINYAGNLGYDSPYQVRAGASYQFRWGILVAASLRENSGLPQSRTYNITQALVPGLTQVTQSVLVAPSGAFRYPWQNLLDLRFSKIIHIGERVTLEPTADLFNVFNCSAITSQVNTVGSALGTPSGIDFGRMLRLGGQIHF